jgi:hypothetical protein
LLVGKTWLILNGPGFLFSSAVQLFVKVLPLSTAMTKSAAYLINKNKIFYNKMNRQQPSLIFCILMDLVGYATYAVPLLGELGDVFWAPLSSIIFFATFGGWKGVLGGFGNFLEELLPGTDFIPSFTIMWFIQNMQKKNTTTQIKLSGK